MIRCCLRYLMSWIKTLLCLSIILIIVSIFIYNELKKSFHNAENALLGVVKDEISEFNIVSRNELLYRPSICACYDIEGINGMNFTSDTGTLDYSNMLVTKSYDSIFLIWNIKQDSLLHYSISTLDKNICNIDDYREPMHETSGNTISLPYGCIIRITKGTHVEVNNCLLNILNNYCLQ
jgi:hypothetical protein